MLLQGWMRATGVALASSVFLLLGACGGGSIGELRQQHVPAENDWTAEGGGDAG